MDTARRDRLKSYKEEAIGGSYGDAIEQLLDIAVTEGYWDEGGDGNGGIEYASADRVAELERKQEELFEAMKRNRERITAIE